MEERMTSSGYFEDTRIPREKLTRYEEFTAGKVKPYLAQFSRFLAGKLKETELINPASFTKLMTTSLDEIKAGSVSAPKELVGLNPEVYDFISYCLPIFAPIGFSQKFTLEVNTKLQDRIKSGKVALKAKEKTHYFL